MIVTIHQPEHMPWLGFFHKISKADVFVILDNVQFRKNYFQNRNKIRTANGWSWITVPVSHDSGSLIRDVKIAQSARWEEKWWKSLYLSYTKSKYFNLYGEAIHAVINTPNPALSELNIALIDLMRGFLDIKNRIILASELDVCGCGSDLVLNICKKLKADEYLSGISGKEYLNAADFVKAGISLTYQEFHHPIYKQLYEPFLPCMSIIDLLFNRGPKSLDIINGIGVPVMEDLFL